MKLIIQPIMLDGTKILGDISLIIPTLVPVFGFEKQTVIINRAVSQLPGQLFDSKRNQYQSDHLLSWLQQTLQPLNNTKLLAVCAFDAYFGNYNFCFGEAIIGGRVAAVYLGRLLPYSSKSDNNSDINDYKLQTLFRDRLVKEAIHELGHTFGMRHCSLDSCIMYKSKTISDTDNKGREFCKICRGALANSIGSPLD
jgi:archaemetzincin